MRGSKKKYEIVGERAKVAEQEIRTERHESVVRTHTVQV